MHASHNGHGDIIQAMSADTRVDANIKNKVMSALIDCFLHALKFMCIEWEDCAGLGGEDSLLRTRQPYHYRNLKHGN